MTESGRIEHMAIIALGLMGGSLGLAAKKKKIVKTVTGYARRLETRKLALSCGAVDKVYARVEKAVENADLIVFCTPVNVTAELIGKCIDHFLPGAVVTDVGSTKEKVVNDVNRLLQDRDIEFIGSHPLAGSEKQGLEAASATFYDNAKVVLTPTSDTRRSSLHQLEKFWNQLGAETLVCSPEEHDKLLARTSHLPHIISFLLALTVARDPKKKVKDCCGRGFWDTTRIADSSPDLWYQIVAQNRDALLEELSIFREYLSDACKFIETDDFGSLHKLLEQSRELRRKLKRETS